jgi:hypothetical protein
VTRVKAFLLLAVVMWHGSSQADVLIPGPPSPSDPRYYVEQIGLGPLNVGEYGYAPSQYAKRPYEAPFGTEALSITWEPLNSTFVVGLYRDASGYRWLMTSKRSAVGVASLRPHCWYEQRLGNRLNANNSNFWTSKGAEFTNWYSNCKSAPQSVRDKRVAEFTAAGQFFDAALRNMGKRKPKAFLPVKDLRNYIGFLGEGDFSWEAK